MKQYPDVDAFLADAGDWQAVIRALREILLDGKLDETIKWGKPCYTYREQNVAIIQPFKDSVALLFFKGLLLDDPDNILEPPGPNSHAGRRIRFQDSEQVILQSGRLHDWIGQAIDAERSGREVPAAPRPAADYVAELREALEKDATLRQAFEALTPGRRRAYDLHFSGAKQAATRKSRIAKHRQRILDGKGLNDR
ncbi:YdeI/OmpD-associated family protein [Lewinella sp. IMCC34191]|uniref:YdeI/OmpD-associated family protein n=1 Tax=Lewinella sp. IMCC34191 TaxID=2259172 RepID=UPI000E23BD23|nr:DUF1801 domain-containing protein [Lewinella sp. IMCC34191]